MGSGHPNPRILSMYGQSTTAQINYGRGRDWRNASCRNGPGHNQSRGTLRHEAPRRRVVAQTRMGSMASGWNPSSCSISRERRRNSWWNGSSPPFSRVFVAKSRRRRQGKARARRAPEAYLTVRRGARRSGTQHWRMYTALQQTTREKCGLEPARRKCVGRRVQAGVGWPAARECSRRGTPPNGCHRAGRA